MKRNYHKLLILIFSLMTVWMVAFPTEAAASSPRISISNNTIMYVSGEGDAESSIIWSSLDRTTIKEIVVESGITGLGDRIFRGFSNVTSVEIASTVTHIGMEAFNGCSSLGQLKIPASVTKIGDYAFAQCTALYYIGLVRGLESIGSYAFSDCVSLPKVSLPASLNQIGDNIFSGCQKLTEIALQYGSTSFSVQDKVLFNANGTVLIAYPKGLGLQIASGGQPSGLYQVPEGTLIIGKYAFSGCNGLLDVTLPESVQTIENNAFSNCQNLQAVTIPKSVTSIGAGSFYNCPNLTIYGERGSYAQTYASSNNIPFKELQGPQLGLSDRSISVSVIGMPTYEQQVAAAKTLTVTNLSERPVKVETQMYKGEYPVDGASAVFWPGNPVATLNQGESLKHTVTPREVRCGRYEYSLHVFANDELYAEVPVYITFTHNPSLVVGTRPTCTVEGVKEHYKCYICNRLFWDRECTQPVANISETVIPALGHDWDEPTYSWSEENTQARATRVCRRDPSHIDTETVDTKYEEIMKPTCTTMGIGGYTAVFENPAFQEQTKKVDIPALGHDWSDWEVIDEPTCEEPGHNVRYCSRCNDFEVEEIPALGHDWDEPMYSWSEDYTEARAECICKRDRSHVLIETVPTKYEEIAKPTCTTIGIGVYTAVFKNPAFKEQTMRVEIPALGHDWGDWVGKEKPTCEKPGLNVRFCSRCDAVETEEIPALGHEWGEPVYLWSEDNKQVDALCRCERDSSHVLTETAYTEYTVTKEPTCEEEGVGTYRAGFINKVFWGQTKDVPIPPLGHDYGEPTYTWSEDNTKVRAQAICKRDPSHVIEEEVNTEYTVTKEPTCTEEGIGTYTAGFEHKIFWGQTKDVKIPALGHDYKEVEGTAIKPTCTEDGKEADQQCSRCKDLIKGKVIPALGHKEEMIPAVDPTCTKDGFTEGKKCSVCGALLEEPKVVPALGHDWDDPTYTWSEDNAQVTAECVCKRDSSHVITETVDTELTVTKKPTCTEDGFGTYTAGFINKIFWGQTKEAAIPATGHSWDQGVVTTPPTTTAEGVKTYTCTACGATRTETIPKLTPAADPELGTVTTLDGKAKALSENGDPAGSSFSILQVKGKKVKKTSITIAWKPVPKATGYVVYGAPCGSKYTKLRDIAGTSFKQSSLKKGKYYKYFVAAHDKNGNILATSKTVHIATTGGKKGNTKSVKLNKKKASLKVGKTFKLKATLKNGKLKVKNHRKVAYETDNPKVATVSRSGKIKAVGKGTCYVYAYAQNGVFARCKVTVK